MVGKLQDRLHGLHRIYHCCKGASILDLGCSWGYASMMLVLQGATSVVGIEDDTEACRAAAYLFKDIDCNFKFINSRVELYTKQDKFDIVLALGIIHHVPIALRKDFVRHIFLSANNLVLIRTPKHDYTVPENFFLFAKSPHDKIGALHIYVKNLDFVS